LIYRCPTVAALICAKIPITDRATQAKQRTVKRFKSVPVMVHKTQIQYSCVMNGRHSAASTAWGESAPPPMSAELPINYRRRLARRFQRFSKEFSDTDLGTITDPTLRGIEQRIRADAIAASACPASESDGVLIPRTKRDETGRIITEWFGSPRVWIEQFAGNRRRVAGFRTNFPSN
jgi:hypothetical protein